MENSGSRTVKDSVYNNLTYQAGDTVKDPGVLKIWPGWNIVDMIGAGSYGKVYEIHRRNGNWVEKAAMKLIRIPSSPSEMQQLRMGGLGYEDTEAYLAHHVEEIRKEIGLMQRFVGNSNIVSYEDYMIQKHEKGIGWDILIRMELLQTLPEYMSTHSFSETDVIRLGTDISQALILCHNAGIIHRDIKPQNIFVNDHGFFKLGDFGISRIQSGADSVMSFKGTPSFMAPETYAMRGTDSRSDIYSLALVLYCILNGGKAPFLDTTSEFSPASSEYAQKRRLMGETVPAPMWGSSALKSVLARALAPDPESRYQTAEQFREALKNVEAGKSRDEGTLPPEFRRRRTRTLWAFDSLIGGVSDKKDIKKKRSATGQREEQKKTDNRKNAYPEKQYRKNEDTRKKKLIAAMLTAAAFLLFFSGWCVWENWKKEAADQQYEARKEPEQNLTTEETLNAGLQDENNLNENDLKEDVFDETGSGNKIQEDHQPVPTRPSDRLNPDSSIISEENRLETDAVEDTEESTEWQEREDDLPDREETIDELEQPVYFADTALEDAIRKYLKSEDSIITKRTARSVETLELSGKGKREKDTISDLTGLEEFENLKILRVDENRISDISALSGLTELQTLHLESNIISDLSPIADISGLKRLDLCHNAITDISVVAGFSGLEMLDIRENMVYDISSLEDLIEMKELYMSDNRIRDIGPIHNLCELTYLSFNNNPVDNLSPVANMDKLRTLCLSGTRVSDIRVLERLPELNYLDIQGCPVSSNNRTLRKLKERENMQIKR